MALISPGLQLSVTDESQYVPGAVGTTPLLVLATAQDKTANGSYAAGTSKANAGKLQVFTSQRELVAQLGYPIFKQSASGTPIHGSPLNEYGLMTAYSALAGANRLYAIRADIDLDQLEATSIRPIGEPEDSTYWIDLAEATWGIFEWDFDSKTFTEKTPVLITDEDDTEGGSTLKPLASIGNIGDYAVTAIIKNDLFDGRVFKKDSGNVWRRVGSDEWRYRAVPAVIGTELNPTVTIGDEITINGTTVTFTGTTLTQVVADINNTFVEYNADDTVPQGIRARNNNGYLELYVTYTTSGNDPRDGKMIISNSVGTPLADLGITAATYDAPTVHYGSYVDVPNWGASASKRPSGSVYIKTSATGGGMNVPVKKFNADSGSWTSQAAPVYRTEEEAIYAFDPVAGGFGTAAGTLFFRTRSDYALDFSDTEMIYRLYVKQRSGISAQTQTPTGITGGTIEFLVSQSGSSTLTSHTVTIANGSSISDYATKFVTAIAAANIPEVRAVIRTNGDIQIQQTAGGLIKMRNLSGTPLTSAGFTFSNTRDNGTYMFVSNYVNITDTTPVFSGYPLFADFTAPYKAPEDGTLWYFGDPTQVDIMINDGTAWKGYRNVTTDARGYNLALTDSLGPIITPTKPKTNNSGGALAAGDIWLDTSDLENYPKLYRYNTSGQWVSIDNTDRTSQNGIVFADARWDGYSDDTGGTADVIADDLPDVVEMLESDYVDLDAPNPRLYPRGTLLFNTRRSGFNVKKYIGDYFNEDSFPEADSLPDVASAWVGVSGLKDSGAPYMGTQAQRNMVVKAMRSALDGNTQVREEQFFFNLIVTPGYPELITNMVALNNDRKNTAFVIGDTPLTLPANSIRIANWANNTNGDGLSTADPYLGVFYPSGLTNDVDGNTIVVPASHMMLRTFIRNDNISYQWFAPAGTRRGLIDNATDIGYVDSSTGSFVRNGINQGMRDALYENRVNPLTILPGVGLVTWGQKTRNPTASAMDRINVARLVNYIRTILASVGNGFLFEPNDKITRDQIKSIIEGALNDLVAKRAVYDYLVVCDSSNNTPDRIARNELYVDIAIEPMKAVEYIYIPIRLKNPGDIAKLGG
jgi:hypothetical protein